MSACLPEFDRRYFAIRVAALPRATALAPGSSWAKLGWHATDGSSRGWLRCEFAETSSGDLSLRIPAQYAWQGGSLRLLEDSRIPLVVKRRRSLPLQYAFRCPGSESYRGCEAQSSTLYLPPERQVFACSRCAEVPVEQILPEQVEATAVPTKRWSLPLPLLRTVLAFARSF